MKILSIREGAYDVGAVVQERRSGATECLLLDQVRNLEKSFQASGKRLLAYLSQMAERGPASFSSDQMHLVDAQDKIYEFVAGRLRLLFFHSSTGKMVVCSHMFVKKTQKAPAEEVDAARRIKVKFEADVKSNSITWVKKL